MNVDIEQIFKQLQKRNNVGVKTESTEYTKQSGPEQSRPKQPKIDSNRIFDKLKKNNGKLGEKEEKEENDVEEGTKESMEEAKYKDVITEVFMGVTEDIHGGEEKAGEVEGGNSKADTDGAKSTDGKTASNSGGGGTGRSNGERIDGVTLDSVLSKKIPEPDEELRMYIINLILKIASKVNTRETEKKGKYDVNAIAKHLLTGQNYKIIYDKSRKKPARKVTFFIDSSRYARSRCISC